MIVVRALRAALHWLGELYDLIHNGDKDMDAVYPDRYKPSGSEMALQGAVVTSLITQASIR